MTSNSFFVEKYMIKYIRINVCESYMNEKPKGQLRDCEGIYTQYFAIFCATEIRPSNRECLCTIDYCFGLIAVFGTI